MKTTQARNYMQTTQIFTTRSIWMTLNNASNLSTKILVTCQNGPMATTSFSTQPRWKPFYLVPVKCWGWKTWPILISTKFVWTKMSSKELPATMYLALNSLTIFRGMITSSICWHLPTHHFMRSPGLTHNFPYTKAVWINDKEWISEKQNKSSS